MIEFGLLVLLGLVVGFFAGLFGIGGGAIMVPVLTSYFLWQQLDPNIVVHLALATSMSCIVINAIFSIYTHQQHNAIIWSITAKITPMVLLGSTLATYWVISIKSTTVALIFMCLMMLVALQMIMDFKPRASKPKPLTVFQLFPAGLIIGSLSAMIAIGGGSLTVPFLNWHQVNIKKAIATAASIGLPIAVASCLVFVFQQQAQVELLNNTWGYIYWPATLAISLGSIISTPIGARLTHKLPINVLKKGFAVLITLLALRMYLTL